MIEGDMVMPIWLDPKLVDQTLKEQTLFHLLPGHSTHGHWGRVTFGKWIDAEDCHSCGHCNYEESGYENDAVTIDCFIFPIVRKNDLMPDYDKEHDERE